MDQPIYLNADDLPQNIISIDSQYKVREVLSNTKNGQGKVFLVVKDTNLYAAKLYKNVKSLQNQLKYIIKLKQSKYTTNYIYHNKKAQIILKQANQQLIYIKLPVLIMQFVQHGDLMDFILNSIQLNQNYRIPLQVCKNMLQQMLIGLKYIHNQGVFHRDIKLQNLCFDQNFDIKFADFGHSCETTERVLDRKWGTQGYRAPQVQFQQLYDQKSDIFSIGYCFYCLSISLPPFSVADNNNFYRPFGDPGVNNANLQKRWAALLKKKQIVITEEVKKFFATVFLRKYQQRPSIEEILLSPILDNKANTQYTRNYLKNQFNYCVENIQKLRKKVTKIRQIKQQLQRLKQMRNNNMMQEQQPTTRGIFYSQAKLYEQLIQLYKKEGIDEQKLKVSKNIYEKFAVKSPLSNLLAHLEMNFNEIYLQKKNSLLFAFMSDYKLISADFSAKVNKDKQIISLNFTLQSKQNDEIHQGQNKQSQANEQSDQDSVEESKLYLIIQGQIFQRQNDKKILIRWQKKEGNDLALQLILRQMKRVLQEFVEAQM